MKFKFENEKIDEIIDDILMEEVLDEIVGNPFKSVSAPRSGRMGSGGKKVGLEPTEEPAPVKKGLLARLGQKLGIGKDWEKEMEKISDTEKEQEFAKPFDEEPPPIQGLETGEFIPKPGDVYAYMTKTGKRAIIKILGGTFGKDARGGASLSVQRIGPGYANRGILGVKQLADRMRGKFDDEETARKALALSVAATMQEMKTRIKENLRNK